MNNCIKAIKAVIVEDNEMFREMLVDYLEFYLNRKVVSFETADEAWEYLQKEPADLVISDVDMPGLLNGIALGTKIKEKMPKTILVIMSGDPGNEDEASLVSDHFFSKPFYFEQLVMKIDELLNSK